MEIKLCPFCGKKLFVRDFDNREIVLRGRHVR